MNIMTKVFDSPCILCIPMEYDKTKIARVDRVKKKVCNNATRELLLSRIN